MIEIETHHRYTDDEINSSSEEILTVSLTENLWLWEQSEMERNIISHTRKMANFYDVNLSYNSKINYFKLEKDFTVKLTGKKKYLMVLINDLYYGN